jgi:hypothetical protein
LCKVLPSGLPTSAEADLILPRSQGNFKGNFALPLA